MPSVPSATTSAPGDEIIDATVVAPSGTPCPSCGCPVEADDKFCPACGTANASMKPAVVPTRQGHTEPVNAEVVVPTKSTNDAGESRHFRCQNCGSEVRVDLEQRSYHCPFCDSNYVVEFTPEEANRQQPEFIIGFAVTPDQAREKFRAWINTNAWYNPGDLSPQAVEEKQRGVYLPFWSFPMLALSTWQAQIGEHWQRTETYTETDSEGKTHTRTRTVTETEWRPLSGKHHRFYSGYLVSGSKGLPQSEALRITPFNLPALKRYEPYFLAGWICEEYSIGRDDALVLAREEYSRQEQRNIKAFLPGDTSSSLEVSTRFRGISSDLCLLPVYILSYRYREKLYRFLVNGQTGKVDGDKPISGTRIAIAVGIGIAVLVAVGLIFMAIAASR